MSDDTNYSGRRSAGTLVGTEVIPVWKDATNSSCNRKTTVNAIATYVKTLPDTTNGKTYVLTIVNGILTPVEV